MSTVTTTLIAIADLSFLAMDVYDRIKGDPEQEANISLLKSLYEQVKSGATEEQLLDVRQQVNAMTDQLIERRKQAIDDYLNN